MRVDDSDQSTPGKHRQLPPDDSDLSANGLIRLPKEQHAVNALPSMYPHNGSSGSGEEADTEGSAGFS